MEQTLEKRPSKKRLTIYVESDLVRRLKLERVEQSRPVGVIVEEILVRHLATPRSPLS